MFKSKRVVVDPAEDDTSEDEFASEDENINEPENDAQFTQSDDNNSDVDQDSDNAEEGLVNTGWADSIAKILKTNKRKGKKTVVLSKAKKLADVKKIKIKEVGFEVEAKDGQIKKEHFEESDSDNETAKQTIKKRKKHLPVLRVKPDILTKDRERLLSKIATKGVVQLFNAVKKQQKDIDSKLKDAGPLEVKRDKVLKSIDKREFLNVLMGGKTSNTSAIKNETRVPKNEKTEDGPTWKVLRDDFMMSAKMKDWDKELEEDVDMKEEDST